MTPPGAAVSPMTSAQALHPGRVLSPVIAGLRWSSGKGDPFLQHPHLGGKEESDHGLVIVRPHQDHQVLAIVPLRRSDLLLESHAPPERVEPGGQLSPLVTPDDVPAPLSC